MVSQKRNPLTGKINTTKRVIREKSVVKYINDVYYLVRQQKIKAIYADRLHITIRIYPPDEKKRDIDNVCKAILDSLQYAGVYTDDFNIWILHVERMEVRKHGEVEFTIRGLI